MKNDYSDRRKERRHVVSDIEALVDGVECQILDISASAVRVLKPADYDQSITSHLLALSVEKAEYTLVVRATGTEIRCSNVDVVITYAQPFSGWAQLLRSLDTFEQTKITELSF